MQTAQRIIKNYRRNRLIVCTVCALLTLILTLTVRFISERNLNHRNIVTFANHAVEKLDNVFLPLQTGHDVLLPLIDLLCSVTRLPLSKHAARLQTMCSINLIQSGVLYCSSISGYRNVPICQLQPELPSREPQLLLSTNHSLIKGSPILTQWCPSFVDGEDGALEIVNIDLLSSMLLEPQPPQITDASLAVGNRHLLYDQGVADTLPKLNDEKRYQLSSQHFPFIISVTGPGPSKLAIKHLPTQLPLAVVLSLLVGYLAWLATASRMGFFWETNLALAAREFELFCQPLLDAQTQQYMGVEILLRWNDPRQGWISPEVFIPIAEEHNLIVPLTYHVIAETIQQRHVLLMSGQSHTGINVAASHFRNGMLLKDLNQYWFNQHLIQQSIIELTERGALLDVDYRVIRELDRLGVKLAIDDLGIGSNSLSWLEKFCPDVPKIDKSFTSAMGADAVSSAVTDIIIVLGKKLNIELMAEGVETQARTQHLRRRGVHLLQGFLYAKPMPLRDFPKWLTDNTPPPTRHNGRHSIPVMPFR